MRCPTNHCGPCASASGKAGSALLGLIFLAASFASAQSGPQRAAPPAEIQVFAAADESSATVGTLPAGTAVTPIAESRGAGAVKWYLVRIKSGVIGWIKHDDSEQTKKVDDFFRSLPAEPSGIASPIPTTSANAAPRGAVTVPVNFRGRSVIVPVTFNGAVTANLLLDTGASMTMITDRVAASLRLPSVGSKYLVGVGGAVHAPVVRVDSVKVGDAEIGSMPVSIYDPFRNPNFEGLLGMDFLSRFQISVDPEKKLLVLTPR